MAFGSGVRDSWQNPGLPSNVYRHIGDILNEKVTLGQLVNVVGLVKDYLAPRCTSGAGWLTVLGSRCV